MRRIEKKLRMQESGQSPQKNPQVGKEYYACTAEPKLPAIGSNQNNSPDLTQKERIFGSKRTAKRVVAAAKKEAANNSTLSDSRKSILRAYLAHHPTGVNPGIASKRISGVSKPGASRMKERMPVIKQKRALDDQECSPNPHTTHEVSHDAIEPPPPFEPPADKARYKKPERRIHIVHDTKE